MTDSLLLLAFTCTLLALFITSAISICIGYWVSLVIKGKPVHTATLMLWAEIKREF